ncbi:MAG: DUF1698 domain-containing protein [Gemmatimonadota bacterium]
MSYQPPAAPPDVAVLLGTVGRPEMVAGCIGSVRASLDGSGLSHVCVVAVGTKTDPALPWLRQQPDVRLVLGGMEGAIPAFNRAWDVARKIKPRFICQINDDVEIVGDSLAAAVRHMEADEGLGMVVFTFSVDRGVRWLGPTLAGGYPHPNQIVARRELVEEVAEELGGFWGDEEHRTHPTYGGDTLFGMTASRLGWRAERLPDVRCFDLIGETTQELRQRNQAGFAEHEREFAYRYPPSWAKPVRRLEDRKMDARPRNVAGTAGIDKSRFGPLMDRYRLEHITGMDPAAFRAEVEAFVQANPYEAWRKAWQGNSGTFLQTLCWGADREFVQAAPGRPRWWVKGGMDDRHLTNLERVVRPGGLDVARDVVGKLACVVGCWCGEEMLLLRALDARGCDGVEEVPEYARLAQLQIDAYRVPGRVWPRSLYSLPLDEVAGLYDLLYVPGVLYHLTDPVAALLTFWAMLKPGGVLAFETVVTPTQGGPRPMAAYLGASVVGWNWWAPTPEAYTAMMRDCGFVDCRQVDQVPGRAWFMGERSDRLPLLETGAAGFSRPDLLDEVRALAGIR